MNDEQAVIPHGQHEIDPFEEVANSVGGRSQITGDLLRFTKRGEYRAGQEKALIPEGTRMLAYVPGLKRGWVRWQDGLPVQHIIGLVSERFVAPARETLGDDDQSLWPRLGGNPNDPWQFTYYLVMCDQEGQLFTFTTASKSGFVSIGALCGHYFGHRKMKPDEIPVVELHSRPWQHPDFGDMIAPDLKVVGWSKIPDTFEEVARSLTTEQAALGLDKEPELFEITPKPAPVAQPVEAAKNKSPVKPAPTQKPKRNSGRTLRL